jgi:hypothetical protein
MNQQLIFNHDFTFDASHQAVCCSVLQAGLRLSIRIRLPEGWLAAAWLAQVKEDAFFWEDEIEAALNAEQTDAEGVLWLDGSIY